MKPKLYAFIILSSLLAVSCRTAKKMYEKGNYDEAVELAAKKLQKDPHDPKFVSIIREAYRYAEEDHQANIRSHSQSNNELKWEWIYYEYADLQKMYEAINRVPEIRDMLWPVDYSSYLTSYGERAGDVRFDRGNYFMQNGDKQSFRNAYREFQAALRFKPGHRDITMRLEEAHELAVTNVIVHPVNQYGGYLHSGYAPGGLNFEDQIVQQLQFNSGNEFTRFYSSWDARANGIRPDLELEMHLSRLEIGNPQEIRDRKRVSKEVVVKETVYKPDSVVKEYATVHADIVSVRRTLYSEVALEVHVRDANGSWIWNDHFPATHRWSSESVSFTGDQRALSDADRARINQSGHVPPHERDIVRSLLDEVSGNAVYRIRNFVNSYL